MSSISRIDKSKIRASARSSDSSVDRSRSDLPLDHQLTFKRDADEEWKYRDGHILINDTDVEEVLGYDIRDVRLWCAISEALVDYREDVRCRASDGNVSGFMDKMHSVQDKVLFNMKRFYDEKTDGLYLSFGDGELLFNNFNVRAFLALYHLRPTEKARLFLMGLKSKLALILVNKNGTHQFERVHGVIRNLYEEVIGALEIQPIETHRLSAPDRGRTL